MASFLITGTNRGLGLALVQELLARPTSEVSVLIAVARKPSQALENLEKAHTNRMHIVSFDVTNEESIKAAVPEVEEILQGRGLDVLINNAGVAEYAMGGLKMMDNLSSSIQVNVLGVHWVTRNFLSLLHRGMMKKVVNISTTLGSMALAPQYTFMPAPAYKISKAALNMLTVQYALDHGQEGFSFMALSPGWLKTDLGGGDMADLTPEQGAKASIDLIYRPNEETNGQYLKVFVKGFDNAKGPNVYDGKNAPW